MKRFSAAILFIILTNILLSQPMNDWDVKVITDTTAPRLDLYKACHASTIEELTPGRFIVSWFGGSYEGADDVGIWISFYENNNWSKPLEVATGKDSPGNPLPCWNPVLFKTSSGRLILFYKIGKNPREWKGYAISSNDDGTTWSSPYEFPIGFLGPIKNKPIQLADGKILCPSSVETEGGDWSAHLEITNEDFTGWKMVKIEKDDTVGVIQPSILTHPDGNLQMLCRSKQNAVYETWSYDNGNTWTKVAPSSLPNPNSGIDAVSLKDGRYILVYNPLLHGKEWYNGRNVLNVAISGDGKTWEDIYQLENEKDGEFSYPAVIQAEDGSICIAYTYRRELIKYVALRIN